MTESKGRAVGRLLLSLLAVATAAAICVAVIDSGGLLYRYGGGRIRSVGFSWVLQIVLLRMEVDPFPDLPAFVSRYSELRSWQQLTQFLVTAIAFNVGLTWMLAAIVSPLYLLFARSRAVLLGLGLLFLSPAVLHVFCEVSIVGLGLHEFKTRIVLALCFMLMLWLVLSWTLSRKTARRVVGMASATGLTLGGLTVVAAALAGLGERPGPPRIDAATGLAGPNILLVSIDSLRSDHLHSYGYPRQTSPAIDALAREGVLFQTAVSDTSWTLPAHMTILTALPQHQHQVNVDRRRLSPSAVSVAEVLDHLHSYGYPRQTSPAIDALAREGVLFQTAVSDTSWTLPAHMTILTALPQHQHQVNVDRRRLSPSAVSVAEVLAGSGYSTAAFVSGPYLRAEYGFYQGFDHYDDYAALTLLNEATSSVTSPTLLGLVQSWLGDWDRAGRHQPFFIFLHMWDVHYDYIPPSPYDTLYDPGYHGPITGENVTSTPRIHREMDSRDLEHLIALHDGEIRFTDHHLGLLFERLRHLNALDDTIIAITSDHGEAFFEHGFKTHRHTLYDELILVPLIIRYPEKIPAGRIVLQQVRLLDLAPTLLSLAEVKPPPEFGMTKGPHAPADLSPLINGEPDFPSIPAFGDLEETQSSVRTDTLKLIVGREGPDSAALYDLTEDPKEQTDLSAQRRSEVEHLHNQLLSFQRTTAPQVRAESMRLDERHLKALRTLGYIE